MAFSYPPPDLSWVEIGRGAPDDSGRWTTWIARLGGRDALYRTLIVADGAASVMVEMHVQQPPVTRSLHRSGCRLVPGGGEKGPLLALLGKADEATRTALASAEQTRSRAATITKAEAPSVVGR
jgi:hypothetical protein